MFGHKHQVSKPAIALRPHAEGAIGDVFLNQKIDLRPLLDAARNSDSAALDDLFHRGYSLHWVDGTRFKSTLKILAQEGCHDAVIKLLSSAARRLNTDRDKIIDSRTLTFLFQEAIRGATLGGHKEIIKSIMSTFPKLDNNLRKIAINQAKIEMGKRTVQELKNLKSLHMLSIALLMRNNQKDAAIELLHYCIDKPNGIEAVQAIFEGAAQNSNIDYIKFVNEIHKRFKIDSHTQQLHGSHIIGAANGGMVSVVRELINHLSPESEGYNQILMRALAKASELGHAEVALMLCEKIKLSSTSSNQYSQIISNAAWIALENQHFCLARSLILKTPTLFQNIICPDMHKWEDSQILRLFRLTCDPKTCCEIATSMGQKWLKLLKHSYNLEKMSDEGFIHIINNPALILLLSKSVELVSGQSEENERIHDLLIQRPEFMPNMHLSLDDQAVFIREMIRSDDKHSRQKLDRMLSTPTTPKQTEQSLMLNEIKTRIKNILEPHAKIKKNIKNMFHATPNKMMIVLQQINEADSLKDIDTILSDPTYRAKQKYRNAIKDCIDVLHDQKYKHEGLGKR